MNIAFFDVDGTLVGGASTERRFFRWLARHGRIGSLQLLAFLWFNVRYVGRYGIHTPKKDKAYLLGMNSAVVAVAANEFVSREICADFSAPCIERLRYHQALGDRVVLLSGTLEPIAQAIATLLGVDEVIATRCLADGEHYTRLPPLQHPFGEEKKKLHEQYLANSDESYNVVYAYGDSHHDIALLSAVDHPVCVNPNATLRWHAVKNDWEIVRNSALVTVGNG